MEADTKYNDTDLCWGPLRRVDAYHIYLVSVLARLGHTGPRWEARLFRPASCCSQRAASARLHTLLHAGALALQKMDHVTRL